MQPNNQLDARSGVLPPQPITVAREAFLDGDFVASVRALESATLLSGADQREALLLRARIHLRQHSAEMVIELLGPELGSFAGIDEACTARMLHAVAVVRSSAASVDRGMALLAEVDAAARALHAHPTIRAEIAYWVAFAHWTKRDFDATLRQAVIAERSGADVVSVRASTLRGFVAAAKERFADALALFRSAREAYDRCRERDRDLLERIVAQIASLEVTLRSARIQGSHHLPEHIARVPQLDGRAAPGVLRMAISAMDAWLYAFDGDRRNAYRKVRICEVLAPGDPWRVWALANRANIAIAFADVDVAAEFAAHARDIADTVDWDATSDEERVGLLFLAEALAVTDPLSAVALFRQYEELTTRIDRTLLFHDDVRLWIVETFVRGLVHRIRGEWDEAWEAFKKASVAARRVGYIWRATLALVELDATPTPSQPRGDFYLEAAAKLTYEHFPRSFIARRLGRWMAFPRDPIVASLARVPREVLRHLLDGKSHKEIGAAMHLAPGTVKNYVVAIHREFGVASTPQLFVACYRRGIGPPSWGAAAAR
jgi:DNA-binding CsgD family transcriptional regulator